MNFGFFVMSNYGNGVLMLEPW